MILHSEHGYVQLLMAGCKNSLPESQSGSRKGRGLLRVMVEVEQRMWEDRTIVLMMSVHFSEVRPLNCPWTQWLSHWGLLWQTAGVLGTHIGVGWVKMGVYGEDMTEVQNSLTSFGSGPILVQCYMKSKNCTLEVTWNVVQFHTVPRAGKLFQVSLT